MLGGGSSGNGDRDAPSNNSQDADLDGVQDCRSDLTANEDAQVTSPLGYRDLDGDGEEEFHNGTDIGVATGTAL